MTALSDGGDIALPKPSPQGGFGDRFDGPFLIPAAAVSWPVATVRTAR
jgi:hypothetical protein